MKTLVLILTFLFFTKAFAEKTSSSASSASTKEMQVEQIMKDLNDLDEEEIKEVRKALDVEVQKKYDERRSKKLGRILLNIRGLGRVRINNCNDLDVKGDSKEVKEFKEELLDFCQQSKKGFFAELDSDGTLKFSFDTSESNNSTTTNIGGGAEFIISYRGHELLLKGNINDNEIGRKDSKSFKRKFDSRVDYSIDTFISNLEAFLMWHIDSEDATTTTITNSMTSSGFQRQILATGLRIEILKDKDFLDLQTGLGGGISYRDAFGSSQILPYPGTWSPSVIGTLDLKLKPTPLMTFVSSGRVQRDFHTSFPAWVASQSVSLDFNFNGVILGTKFTVDWDDYRTNAGVDKFGYSGMFTVGLNLYELFGNKEAREEKKKALERETKIWDNANKFADEEEKKSHEETRSFLRRLFGF